MSDEKGAHLQDMVDTEAALLSKETTVRIPTSVNRKSTEEASTLALASHHEDEEGEMVGGGDTAGSEPSDQTEDIVETPRPVAPLTDPTESCLHAGDNRASERTDATSPSVSSSMGEPLPPNMLQGILQGYVHAEEELHQDQDVIQASVVGNKRQLDRQVTGCRYRRRLSVGVLSVLILVLGVVAGVVVSNNGGNSSTSSSPTHDSDIENMPTDMVVASVPVVLCKEYYPGAGISDYCSPQETLPHGGTANALVSHALHSVAPSADIVLMNSGAVNEDILAGDFQVQDIFLLLPFKSPVVEIQLTGDEVMSVIEFAIAKSFDECGCYYPYSSGLRFYVQVGATDQATVTGYEIKDAEGQWVSLDQSQTYSVHVWWIDISVGPMAYRQFVASTTPVTELELEVQNIFLQYALDTGVLEAPPLEESSTQSFEMVT